MKNETSAWLSYADENLDVAELSLANNPLNACLHNTQQAVEKYLKALIIEYDLPFRKTHAIYVNSITPATDRKAEDKNILPQELKGGGIINTSLKTVVVSCTIFLCRLIRYLYDCT